MSSPDPDCHFVPLRVGDLVTVLTRRPELPDGDRDAFRRFGEMVQHIYHFEQHKDLLRLKSAFGPYNPDADTHAIASDAEGSDRPKLDRIFEEVELLARRANFRPLSKADIDAALASRTSAGLNMDVDFSVFDRYAMYVRGKVRVRQARSLWWWPWAMADEEVDAFQRMLVVMKLRPHPRLNKMVDTDHVHLKAFKDIPCADVEMLIPGARVKFTQYDKGMISFPIITALLITTWTFFKQIILVVLATLLAYYVSKELATQLQPPEASEVRGWSEVWRDALKAAALFSIAMVAFGAGYRAWFSYQHKKTVYNLRLTESLYFQSIASNAGVLTWLLDEAEEQECREVILGYFFLLVKGNAEGGWTEQQLDSAVEAFLRDKVGRDVDFEVDDAVGKLRSLKLVLEENGRFRARTLPECLTLLDERWDNYFPYNNERLRTETV